MIERGQRVCFAGEAGEMRVIAGDLGRQQLERDLPLESRVVRPVNLSHAATPEQAADFKRSDPSARRWQGGVSLTQQQRCARDRAAAGNPAPPPLPFPSSSGERRKKPSPPTKRSAT